MAQLVASDATRWQRRNRRYLGVSFAVSHLVHLAALIALVRTDQALFWTLTNPANIVLAGTAYLFIAAMTATSFDRTAAWLGARRWRLLHLIGGWYIWVSFAVSIGKRLPQGAIYWAMMAVVIAVGIVRLIVMSRRAKAVPAIP
jgi:sulfoxide reductase heme-binding subunit YedZ